MNVPLPPTGFTSRSGHWLASLLGSKRRERSLSSVQLRFGSDLSTDAVLAMLSGVAGLPRGTQLGFDVVASEQGIHHFLHADSPALQAVHGLLRGVAPSTRLEPITADDSLNWQLGAHLAWSGRHLLLRTEHSQHATAVLLGTLSQLRSGERVLLRCALRPGRRVALPSRDSAQRPFPWLWPSDSPLSSEHLGALRRKYAGPLLDVHLAIAVTGSKREGRLLSQLASVIRARRGARGQLRMRRARGAQLERLLNGGRFWRGDVLSPAELVNLLGWPIGGPSVPGLMLGTAPLLVPSPRIPSSGKGRVFARANAPGANERPLLQPLEGATSHSLLLGPTGSGKSALITNLVSQDVAQGRGLLLLDMKGDTASDVLARIPKKRVRDVIVLEPASGLPVPGLRVFGDGDPELVADVLLATFRGLFRDSWGVRSDQYLRLAFVTLAHDRGATLADLHFLFSDASYRRRLVGALRDPMLQAAWAAYEALSPQQQAEHLASPLRKINEVVGRRVVRAVLAQAKPRFDMADVLRAGKIVVACLSPGRLGAPAVQLLGALVTYELYSAVLARQAIPESERRAFGFYIDEPKILGTLPIPLDGMFELFRGMGCAITLAGQSITQLPKDVQRAALTNAATLLAFRQSRADAELLARELSGISAEGLQHLGRYEVALRLGLGHGDVAPIATAYTLPPSEPLSDPDVVRRVSAERYGTHPDDVDAALRARHNLTVPAEAVNADAASIGRLRRKP